MNCNPNETIYPGTYVLLEVQDTGCGMTPEIQAKIFDPFFTTKFTGRGLGLSAVRGIVRAHRGIIQLYSEVDNGTCFKLLFPATASIVVVAPKSAPIFEILTGTGNIMIVDDEDSVSQSIKTVLTRFGYSVTIFSDGNIALLAAAEQGSQIDLIILDMTMPLMSGDVFYRKLRKTNSDVKVLVTSGYNESELIKHFEGCAGFIQKPYTAKELATKVKKILSSS